jgi:hypothetical protein
LRHFVLLLFAAISEARYYDRFFGGLSTHLDFFAADFFDPLLSSRLAVVISEALDSIPTFDRPSNPAHLFLRRCPSAFASCSTAKN